MKVLKFNHSTFIANFLLSFILLLFFLILLLLLIFFEGFQIVGFFGGLIVISIPMYYLFFVINHYFYDKDTIIEIDDEGNVTYSNNSVILKHFHVQDIELITTSTASRFAIGYTEITLKDGYFFVVTYLIDLQPMYKMNPGMKSEHFTFWPLILRRKKSLGADDNRNLKLMKRIFLLSSLILFHFITYSQPNIHKITWVGENNEYLNISKKTALLQKGNNYTQFGVTKYAKDNYIIFSKTIHDAEVKQKYNIVCLTKDTLILFPEGEDIFELNKTNEQNQYVFVNSMLNYKFESLYFETFLNDMSDPKKPMKIILFIDSARNSRVVTQNDFFNENKMYRAPISEQEYKYLVKLLSSYDIGSIPEEETVIKTDCTFSILEISYNNQTKKFKGCFNFHAPFADKLKKFICDYIEQRLNINLPIIMRLWITY